MSREELALYEFAMIILMKVVLFCLGYMTIRLGYELIKSGVKGEFKFSASFGGSKADLASVSPGLLFVLLGVSLMAYAIYVEKGVTLSGGTPPMESVESREPPQPGGG